MTITIAEHVKNIRRMRVHKDGDAFFVALDDFVDLQQSPAYFIKDEEHRGRIKAVFEKWYDVIPDPVMYLTHQEKCYLSKKLLKGQNRNAS